MSSARMLLAAVATGLAACAHTPSSNDAIYLPDIDTAAPVLMVNSDIPPGFNDHVVIIVDHDGIARAVRSSSGTNYGLHRYPVSGYRYRVSPHTGSGSQGSGSAGSATVPGGRPVRPDFSAPPGESLERQRSRTYSRH